jgi:5-methylcytosine-specific restriction protein B
VSLTGLPWQGLWQQPSGNAKRSSAASPREEWPTMAIERYAVGLSGRRDTFCRLLEFQTPDLGSIKGGSSRKLIIYKHKDKRGWYFDPSYPDVEAAWRAVREAFVEAFSLAEAHDWAGVDALAPLRSGAALRAKAVFSYAPAGLLPIYSREHIAHFRQLLGDPAQSVDVMQDNHALHELVYERPEFNGWSVYEVMQFLYRWADPRPTRRIVKIAPGPEARFWNDCLQGGYICVGWDEVGDLSEYPSFEDFRPAFEAKHPSGGNQGQVTRMAQEIWALTELEPGDLVVANRGTAAVVGIGVVREPGYQWRPERSEYKHTVNVDWDDTAERSIEPVRRWATVTVAPVSQAQYRRILDAPARDGQAAQPPGKRLLEVTPPEPVLLDIQAAIQRKGQVILHGPPGTG